MSKGDLISREALKEALKSGCEICPDANTNWCEHCCKINDFEDLIDDAPTVEPQDRWGRWVISEIRCPNCLEYFDTDCYSKGELDKCPSCGAKMKGGAI